MKQYIILSAAAMAFAIANAATPEAMVGRTEKQAPTISTMAPKAVGSSMSKAQKSNVLEVRCLGKAKKGSRADEYVPAEAKELISEDFSSDMLSTGEVGAPDLYTTLEDPNTKSGHPAWYNLYPQAVGDGTVIWGGHNIFPAGGCVCLFNKKSYNITESNILVPLVDASADGYEGIVHLQFIARLDDKGKQQPNLLLEAAETNGMSPSWDVLGSGIAEITNDWMIYDVAFYGGGKSVMLNIYNAFGQSVYVDEIIVYQIGQPAMTPIAKPYSDYKGTSFVANWEAAPGAESYLLNVYSVDKTYDNTTGQITDATTTFLLKDEPVQGTSYTVQNAESGRKYYYNVRSVNGEYVSLPSASIEINELVGTSVYPVSNLTLETVGGNTTGHYTAEWDAIPGADVYNYWGRFERVATVDGLFVVTDENFDGVVDHQGFPTGWTKEEPEQYTYSLHYFRPLKQAGWRGLNAAPYTDYICLDGWQYIFGGHDAGLLSPELDLSKDNGKVTVTVDMAATLYSDDSTGTLIEGYPRGAAVIFNFNEEKGDWQQDELYYSKGVDDRWSTQEFTFTTGSKRSEIGIYAVYAPENLYLDNLTVTQNYKAGESLIDPYHFSQFHEGTSIDITVPKFATGKKLFHQVCGTRAERVDGSLMDEIAFLESPYTPLTLVEGSDQVEWAGIKRPSYAQATVQMISDNEIMVLNPERENVTVCDLSGKVFYAVNGVEKQTVNIPGEGTYLVTVGNHTVKVHM